MKIIIAPDSFKGSLSAAEAAEAIRRGISRAAPQAKTVLMPLADGGEGTLDALIAATSGRRIVQRVTGPLGIPVDAAFGLLGPDFKTAIVEMAQAAGLTLMPEPLRDPRRATTYGVGELLLAAVESGAQRIIVGLGGSATNDGGAGALQALGVQLINGVGEIMPDGIGGGALVDLDRIDAANLRFPTDRVTVIIASDVTNPLLGPNGASIVYGPQKGADASVVVELANALSHYAVLVKGQLGRNYANAPGAGAAGGLGFGLIAYLRAEVRSGIGLVLDTIGFDAQTRDADWVFTGEGKIDSQTVQGKVIEGVLERCRAWNIPVLAFGGSVDTSASDELATLGLRAAFPIVAGPTTLHDAMRDGAKLLEDCAARVSSLLAATSEASSAAAPQSHAHRER